MTPTMEINPPQNGFRKRKTTFWGVPVTGPDLDPTERPERAAHTRHPTNVSEAREERNEKRSRCTEDPVFVGFLWLQEEKSWVGLNRR